mmetsp:Transcript_22742/g.52821  ORF Transcript_22742/g.52821 Transcript_22742/m.52821 type:complete len:211 (-) Transcript_22742:141-773(-)|eukprot:CAMPEP_0172018380 /NCGR_PEP_ID=MMETSP1041-20130122/12069_1 /TAXON_ID=464988 /ORGANISM="Hemiselmis andersenii, Strain CCMP439" /LENGTH=210 /DNA_ID=CAMNT_0012673477 /DNA_START=93 /DNA_END=725 /DNA_ORIENTATION=+
MAGARAQSQSENAVPTAKTVPPLLRESSRKDSTPLRASSTLSRAAIPCPGVPPLLWGRKSGSSAMSSMLSKKSMALFRPAVSMGRRGTSLYLSSRRRQISSHPVVVLPSLRVVKYGAPSSVFCSVNWTPFSKRASQTRCVIGQAPSVSLPKQTSGCSLISLLLINGMRFCSSSHSGIMWSPDILAAPQPLPAARVGRREGRNGGVQEKKG